MPAKICIPMHSQPVGATVDRNLKRTGEANSNFYKKFSNWVSALTEDHPYWKFCFSGCNVLLVTSCVNGWWTVEDEAWWDQEHGPFVCSIQSSSLSKIILNHLHNVVKMLVKRSFSLTLGRVVSLK